MLGRRKRYSHRGIDPDEVLLDAFNLPSFDTNQFEGRVERSIHARAPLLVGVFVLIVFLVFVFQAWKLQVYRGEAMAALSQQNRLDHEVVFAKRGVVFDRYGTELAWNTAPEADSDGQFVDRQATGSGTTQTYSLREYVSTPGFGHLLGYVGYPERDTSGSWWRTQYLGRAGVEQSLDDILDGENGVRIIEVDARDNVQSENTIRAPVDGENIRLSVDKELQEALYSALTNGATRAGFQGGAGVVMDVTNGEVLAMTSYPEYSPQVMTDAADTHTIASYTTDERRPFLNRAVLGEYAPGSIVKPYVAAAALDEGIIAPHTSILSTGEIRIPNPYVPGDFSVFRDWKAHGWVNMQEAIAVSSNVYFYVVGGGFENREGLGIERLAAYATRFGLGQKTGINVTAEAEGVVPTPSWKRRVFGEHDPWRIGNTYHTAIGQFGFLVTPIQVVRYIAAIANGGTLHTPTLTTRDATSIAQQNVGIDDEHLRVVREGMRAAAEEGTALSVNVPGIRIAAKTGTAQVGAQNEYMNSWVVGFWPADEPRFAFAAVLEKAPAGTLQGAGPALRQFFEWVVRERPAYVRGAVSKHEKE